VRLARRNEDEDSHERRDGELAFHIEARFVRGGEPGAAREEVQEPGAERQEVGDVAKMFGEDDAAAGPQHAVQFPE
jgi:hypothetical protein